MTSKSLYRFSGIILLIGVTCSVLTSIFLFFIDTSIDAPLSELEKPLSYAISILELTVYSLILIGLPAFYLSQSGGRGGKTGFIGVLLSVISLILHIAMSAYFISVMPILAKQAPDTIKDIFFSNFAFFAFGGSLLFLIGFILLGIASIRAKVYPSYVGVLLIIFPVLGVTDFIMSSNIINLLGSICLAIAFGVVGVNLASGRKAVESDNPISK
ncbi:hypothetical protein KHA93_18465 [Bacillus sp. FJAT-49732]|uniref:DUF4386 family protein n=1 Tax=Lederbergia citrisecunda TaxID=2833583 RepID=A0A942TNP2_9BACI|nr:hypothetical protein [Lederbergia citrisecunda]MBS4201600.1 hypothetical protein [Lederbergia citrisecunda]